MQLGTDIDRRCLPVKSKWEEKGRKKRWEGIKFPRRYVALAVKRDGIEAMKKKKKKKKLVESVADWRSGGVIIPVRAYLRSSQSEFTDQAPVRNQLALFGVP